MSLLEIKNLHVEIDGKKILNGLDLTIEKGKVHAIMGPNGSGKSTLAYVLAGKADYEITEGEILFDGENILEMEPDERAAKGLFLAFQYPIEIPGVATMTFLRTAVNAQRKKRGEGEYSTPEFLKKVREAAAKLDIDPDMLKRSVNVGFSGGEKKRAEILQMTMFEPRLAVLDETDSGLDIDALKVAAEGVNRMRSPERAFLVITHYQRLLDHIVPDVVHVMSRGRIVKTGGKELALELEAEGLRAISPRRRNERRNPPDQDGGRAGLARYLCRRARRSCRARATVAALREAAFKVFEQQGLPHRRIEEWKYTDLRAVMRDAKPLAAAAGCAGESARQGCRAVAGGCRRAAHRVCRRRVRA